MDQPVRLLASSKKRLLRGRLIHNVGEFLGQGSDGTAQELSDVLHLVTQSLKPQPPRCLWNRIKLAPQHVGADHNSNRQAFHSVRKFQQRGPMLLGSFLLQVDAKYQPNQKVGAPIRWRDTGDRGSDPIGMALESYQQLATLSLPKPGRSVIRCCEHAPTVRAEDRPINRAGVALESGQSAIERAGGGESTSDNAISAGSDDLGT